MLVRQLACGVCLKRTFVKGNFILNANSATIKQHLYDNQRLDDSRIYRISIQTIPKNLSKNVFSLSMIPCFFAAQFPLPKRDTGGISL